MQLIFDTILLFLIIITFLYIGEYLFGIYRGRRVFLERFLKNPLIRPEDGSFWESVGTFNPAAIADDDGRVHLVYRAIGPDGLSRFGYAVSEDGIQFHERSKVPIFEMRNPRFGASFEERYDPVMYPSGGSWGGCEDPRMVRMDGKIYITFSAFDGWDFIRMTTVSIDENDFWGKKWKKWNKPHFISPPNEIHKNWVLFPEKINGKFAILHSISPNVQVDYVDDLEELHLEKKKIESRFETVNKKEGAWDSHLRGAGPPPIKTKEGWVVIYHALQKEDPGRYKLGAMLLDLKDPTIILSKSSGPILSPDEWYENDWKSGVVYACGAVSKGDDLTIYYGGGDKTICAAKTSMGSLLDHLVSRKYSY